MLNVTDAAVEQLTAMLDQSEVTTSEGVRLVANQGEVGLQVDVPQEGDQVIAAGERPVLMVGPELAEALDGATLDAVDAPEGKQLTLVGADAGEQSQSRDTSNGAH